jgi:anti-sigma factor RsiW
MSTYTTDPGPHLTDDELLRLIDGEGEGEWRAERDQHVAGCDRCAREVALLADDGMVVRGWLERAAFEDVAFEEALPLTGRSQVRPIASAPGAARRNVTRTVSPWLRAAAVLALLAAPVAAFPGVRAWLSDSFSGSEPAAEVRTLAAPEPAVTAAVIRFVPQQGAFAIDVDAAQAGGALHISRGAGADAVLESTAELADGPVVAAGALRLRNGAADRGSYMLQLPVGVTRVTVRIAGRVVSVIDDAALAAGTTVTLELP